MIETTQQRIERIAERFGSGCPLSNYAFREILKAALTAFAEEQEKWLPISSAPKDGTRIIVFGTPHGSYSTGAPKYQFTYGPMGEPTAGEAYYSAGLWQRKDGTFKDVTHWQPLPPAPSTGEKPE